jgi:hypothetical protein
MASVEEQHIAHLLKTPLLKLTHRRRKSKYFLRLLFAQFSFACLGLLEAKAQ